MLEVKDIPQSYIPYVQIGLSIVLYMRSLLLVESFDLCLSNVLVRVIPRCFHFAKMCLRQVSPVKVQPEYLTSSSWGSLTCVYGLRACFS
jgi:hypothetical protein